jgi:hypothetical protein
VTVGIVVVGDGRYEYMNRALMSLSRFAAYPFVMHRIVQDSGLPAPVTYPEGWEVVAHPQRRGLAAAVQSAWSNLPAEVEFLLHVEEDFLLTEDVDIDAMASCLSANPNLAQLVLKRQPCNPQEAAAGGIIECYPNEYADRDGFVEHKRLFSLNPCLIPRHIIDRGWPDHGGEREFTDPLVADGYTFGFWGMRNDRPRCFHVGEQRSAGWML